MKLVAETQDEAERAAQMRSDTQEGVAILKHLLFEILGASRDDSNFKGTPERFFNFLLTHFNVNPEVALEGLRHAAFESKYEGMVTETGIKVFGLCPHHLLSVRYSISIGYLASGKVLGLSKLVHLVNVFATRPALQEDITEQIADGLQTLLDTKGVGVVIRGRHSCLAIRGVKASPWVTTSTVRGVLRESASAKEEFLMLTREAK